MNDLNKPVDSSETPAPSGNPSKPRQLRVHKSTAAMMASSRPAARSPWGAAVVLFLLLAGGIAAWWWRADWWPQTRGWWEAHRPGAAASQVSPAAPRAEPSATADADDIEEEEEFVEFPQRETEQPEPAAADSATPVATAPAVPFVRGRNAGASQSPAALFNEAFRDYQTFLTDKQAHADMLPGIIERAFRAAKGFEAMLDLADDEKKAQVNEAMSQCYRLISDCRRQNTEAVRSLQEPSTSTHAPFNRATVGPKRKPPLKAPEPAPAASP